MVALLAGEGMSARAIAPIVGATKSQVHRDMGAVPNGTPATVTGLDGKEYSRPTREPQPAPKEAPSDAERLERFGDTMRKLVTQLDRRIRRSPLKGNRLSEGLESGDPYRH